MYIKCVIGAFSVHFIVLVLHDDNDVVLCHLINRSLIAIAHKMHINTVNIYSYQYLFASTIINSLTRLQLGKKMSHTVCNICHDCNV